MSEEERCVDCGAAVAVCDHAAARLLDPERSFHAGQVADLEARLAEISRDRAQERAEAERTVGRLQAEVELLRSRP